MATYGIIAFKSIREIKAYIRLYFRNLITAAPIIFRNGPN